MKNQETVTAIQRALEILGAYQELPDDPEMVEALRDAGFPTQEAERLVGLLPLAFGRAALQRFGIMYFPNDARVRHPDGSTTEILLSDQPIYKAALQLAAEMQESPAAAALAARSVEVMLLAPSIQAGQAIDIRGLSAPLFFGYDKGVFMQPPWWRRRLF
ncbi:MAG TPA: hypothetical protein VMW27_00735 [Thermoanaerobaculia bacterium]|nr:hypothetical protein [Thermoanaerobaculia bacterium]